MNRFSPDRYRAPSYDRYSSLSRSKSPYRSTSSLNSHASSSSNLKVDTNNFDLLNQSLGRHDASFVLDDNASVKSGANYSKHSRGNDSDYSNASRLGSAKKDRFNVAKLNKDYSINKLGDTSGGSSSDYDLNNNYQFSSYVSGGKGAKASTCLSGSESDDYELSVPSYQPYRSRASKLTSSLDKGDLDLSDHSDYSDESMSEYIHCKSFCPDSVSDSKLFVSFEF